ncbi:MAG: type II CAAX endopeptidase family protein [Caldilineaceae bacterium]
MTTTTSPKPYIAATTDASQRVRQARQGLLVFAGFLIPLSLFGYWFYVNYPDAPLTLPSLPLMLAPGVAAVLTRWLRREGFADVSFRLHGRRMKSALLLAFALPLIAGGIAYSAAYLLGLAQFDPAPFPVALQPAAAQFALNLVFAILVFIPLLTSPATTGEEIGWRGYLLPRLIDARLPQPVLLTALIWGVWHLPVVFAGGFAAGPSVLLSAGLLVVTAAALGCILGWLRLETGSIWPCILTHAAWNAIINGAFGPATHGAAAKLWTGESGILVVAALVVAALLIQRLWYSSPPAP